MPFCVLFDSGDPHLFIYSRAALQLNLKKAKDLVNYKISLGNGQVIECVVLYKHLLIVIVGHEFQGNLT